MKDFLKGTKFKILLGILIVLFAFLLRGTVEGSGPTLLSQVAGAVTAPLQRLSSSITRSADEFFGGFVSADQLREENAALEEEVRRLREEVAQLQSYRNENEYLREYLDIREENPDFEFQAAEVIQRDPNDRFCSFMIDKGSLAGVAVDDPVISADGLVGRVTEVGLTYSKVVTILDVAMDVGVYDANTRDTGILEGDAQLAGDGQTRLSLLPLGSQAAAGDLVLTTGVGGIYPKDIMVGQIVLVDDESHGKSLYAVIQPAADIASVTDVLVITDFLGQGDVIQ